MDLDTIRPLVSGLIGGIISLWLIRRFAKSVPDACGKKTPAELVKEHRAKILLANALFFLALAGGLASYHFGYFARNDWHGLLLTFGSAAVAPVLFLFLCSVAGGSQRVKEAYVAYAISQRVPMVVLYAGFALGATSLLIGLCA